MFFEHKKRLLNLLKIVPVDSTILLFSGVSQYKSADTYWPFRVDSNFYYLTGLDIPGAYYLLRKYSNDDFFVSVYIQETSIEDFQWTGLKVNVDLVKSKLDRVIEVKLLNDLDSDIRQHHTNNVFISKYQEKLFCDKLFKLEIKFNSSDLDKLISNLRVIKSEKEIDYMKRACKISADAHKLLEAELHLGMTEKEVMQKFIYLTIKSGAQDQAYDPIVGFGDNALTLHHSPGTKKLGEQDTVLIDAGCSFGFYSSDITRVLNITNDSQKLIYDAVLHVQKKSISVLKSGNSWQDVQYVADRELTQVLLDMNLLQGTLEENFVKKSFKKYTIHSIGHSLGLDVHDPIPDRNLILRPNMVFTIEPGLYIRELGIGVRIEDDILITEDSNVNLTQGMH